VAGSSAGWQEAVDSNGVHYRWGRPHVPDFIATFHNPLTDQPMGIRPYIPVERYVPTGLYAGEMGQQTWDYVLTKLIERHGNTYYVNGGLDSATRDGQMDIARRAARIGVRIYYQNQSSEIWWPSRIGIGPARQEVYDRIAAWADDMLINFVLNYELKEGILVWAPSEEIDMGTAQEPLLAQLRNDVFEAQDPFHPMIIMLMAGSLDIQEELYNMWGPDIPLIVIDPYFNNAGNPRSNHSNYYLNVMPPWQQKAMDHNARLWIIAACFSQNNPTPSQGPAGWKMTLPQEVSFSCWTGMAFQATGFFLFAEYLYQGFGRACVSRFEWIPTEEYAAGIRFFRTVRRLEPLLSRWTSAQATQVIGDIVEGVMNHPDFDGQFVVIANSNLSASVSYAVPGDGTYYDLETFSRVVAPIELDPGMGVVLFKGSAGELEQLKDLLGPGLGLAEQVTLSPIQAQNWTADAGDEETVASRTDVTGTPIAIGGKGGKPWLYNDVYISEPPSWAGELLDWGDGVRMPAGFYFPPRPGAGENMLFLKWDFSSLANYTNVTVESAAFELPMASALNFGRVGVYPVIGDGDDLLNDVLEHMPRWEIDQFSVPLGGSLRIEIGGMVQQWIDGDLANRGLLVVYNGWPDTTSPMLLSAVPTLKLKYRRQPDTCAERWQAGEGLLADLNQDCYVNWADFTLFADQWLACNDPQDPNCP